MFEDECLSAAVLADMRNVCLLLTRSFVKVVLPSNATNDQKQRYRDAIEKTFEQLNSSILQPIFESNPDLPREILTIKTYLQEL
jgi:hypothetical protein